MRIFEVGVKKGCVNQSHMLLGSGWGLFHIGHCMDEKLSQMCTLFPSFSNDVVMHPKASFDGLSVWNSDVGFARVFCAPRSLWLKTMVTEMV